MDTNTVERDEELFDFSDETEDERIARESTEVILNENDKDFVDNVIEKVLLFIDELSGHPLYGYQRPFSRRMLESIIINDGATLTALFSRQSGKSETVANTVAAIMILFPLFAKMWPQWFGQFAEGVWVGAFAPVDDQADTLFSRIVDRLTSETATAMMADPEIDDGVQGNRGVKGKGKEVKLKNSGSLVRKQTCHPRATIEGRTYHLILIDECQGADEKMVNKSISPMKTSTNGTMVFTGTPTYTKGVFYKTIQFNKRNALSRGRQNHFEADWKECAKWNPMYKKSVQADMRRMGEDSDEFKLSYKLIWLLDQGMFTTSEKLEELGDKSMQIVPAWHSSPVVVGIDPARKQDSTIVTVLWVDWDRPDEMGYYEHRVLNWLDLTGMDWESQYFRIREFLMNYSVYQIAIDVGGVGDVVASRLKTLMPYVEIIEVKSDQGEQSKRWKHLSQLIDRRKIGWPAHAKSRRLKTYKRFIQQMGDLLKIFKGPYVLAEAPNEAGAHDDYADSLALAAILTKDYTMPTVEVSNNFFFN